jgi:hypothetical protein
LEGALRAFHFKNRHLLADELNAERESFAGLRKELGGARENMRAEYSDFKKSASDWFETAQTDAKKWVEEKQETWDKRLENWTGTFDAAFANWTENIRKLETTYREKLRLESPAEYWGQLAKDYEKRGRGWLIGTVVVTAATVGLVGFVLFLPPPILQAVDVTLSGVRGAVLLAAAISALIYLTHLCVRMSTSAYHLSRDARERLQLTHVYYALIHDGSIEPREREIVLQALFSRADTGLLRGDTGPTMPGPLGNMSEVLGPKSK